jgi:hypothetical protein
MARVWGVHEIELVPGTDPDDFERAAAAVVGAASPDGWRSRIMKGERGPRSGQYLLLFEIDSLQQRDQFYPAEGVASDEANAEFDRAHPEAAAAWDRLAAMIVDLSDATDYLEIE